MPGPAHDVLVQALRDDVALLPEILSRLRGIVLPRVVGPIDSVVRLARPVEVRPDVVHRTAQGWVVCEVQHAIDRKKGRRWLVASSVLLDETQRMGDVVVLTASAAVARWARRVGHVRGPAGTRLQITPVVVHLSPAAARALLDPRAPKLALCAAWAMQRRHGEEAARVADDAILVTEHLPKALQDAQVHAILDILNRQLYARLLREAAMHPNQTPERPSVRKLRELLEKQGMAKGIAAGMEKGIAAGMEKGIAAGMEKGIAAGMEKGIAAGMEKGIAAGMEKGIAAGMEKGLEKGRAEGLAEGKRGDLLLVFSERGLPVTAAERARIAACTDVELLSMWVRRAITAGSAAEVLADMPRPKKAAARASGLDGAASGPKPRRAARASGLDGAASGPKPRRAARASGLDGAASGPKPRRAARARRAPLKGQLQAPR